MSSTAATTRSEPGAAGADHLDVRTELLWRLCDVLALPEGRTSANDRAMAADMVCAVLAGVDVPFRVQAARRLSHAAGLPASLVRQLAIDVAEVAQPVLDSALEIPEAVLVEAAGVSGRHREVIVARDAISDALAEALLAADESRIVARVLGFEHVTLGGLRMLALVRRGAADASTRRALLGRKELRAAQGFALFWHCNAAERRRILSRFAMDRSALQDSLQSLFPIVFTTAEPDPLTKRMLRLVDRRHRPRGVDGEVVGQEIVERTLTVGRARPDPEICHAIGLLVGVGTDTATRIMHDAGGEPFAILAKSAGVSRGAFSAVMEGASAMPAGDGPRFDAGQREALLATFDTVARDYARAVLQYWDWRPETVRTPSSGPRLAEGRQSRSENYLGAI